MIIYLSNRQFGYSANHAAIVTELAKEDNIVFICRDQGKSRSKTLDADVKYLSHINRIPLNKIFVDIRTASVSKSKLRRYFENSFLRLNSFLSYRSLVFNSLIAEKIGLLPQKIVEIPLATEQKIIRRDERATNNFLYVGILYGRSLEKLVYSIEKVVVNKKITNFQCRIVGNGFMMKKKLLNLVNDLGLNDYVKVIGERYSYELIEQLKWADYGLSYVPIIDAFQFQPPTKILDYAASGLPVVATRTVASQELMVEGVNGITAGDSIDEYAIGLAKITKMRFESSRVAETVKKYSVKNVVEKKYRRMLYGR